MLRSLELEYRRLWLWSFHSLTILPFIFPLDPNIFLFYRKTWFCTEHLVFKFPMGFLIPTKNLGLQLESRSWSFAWISRSHSEFHIPMQGSWGLLRSPKSRQQVSQDRRFQVLDLFPCLLFFRSEILNLLKPLRSLFPSLNWRVRFESTFLLKIPRRGNKFSFSLSSSSIDWYH